jgi:hypothetical protein
LISLFIIVKTKEIKLPEEFIYKIKLSVMHVSGVSIDMELNDKRETFGTALSCCNSHRKISNISISIIRETKYSSPTPSKKVIPKLECKELFRCPF